MIAALEAPHIKRLWPMIGDGLSITTEEDYDRAVELLNQLLDEVGDDESHPLFNFLDVLGTMIERYEEDHVTIPDVPGSAMLQFLMEQHDLTPSDLPELGTQRTVSAILRGKRELSLRHVKALSTRFHVSPAVFV